MECQKRLSNTLSGQKTREPVKNLSYRRLAPVKALVEPVNFTGLVLSRQTFRYCESG